MMQAFRNAGDSIVTKTLLYILIGSFVLWGIGDYVISGGKGNAVTINGQVIPGQELSRLYQVQLNQLTRQFGQKPEAEVIAQLRVPQQVLAQAIRSTILGQEAKKIGYTISTQQLNEEVQTSPAFQNEAGKFDMNLYQTRLRDYGMTIEGYEKALHQQLMVTFFLDNLFVANIAKKSIIERLAQYDNNAVDVEYITLTTDDVTAPAAPKPAEVEDYFNNNQQRYIRPAYRGFEYISINMQKLMAEVKIPETQLREIYDEAPASYKSEQMIEAAHILVKTEEEAKDLAAKLNTGEDFSKLAKEHSTDPFSGKDGGKLPKFKYTDMVEDFSKAAFALTTEGQISEPVKSAFGWHLIKLGKVYPAAQRTFAEVKNEIAADLKRSRAEHKFFEIRTEIEDRIAGGEALTDIATALKLKLNSTPALTAEGVDEAGKQHEIEPALLTAAFSLEGDEPSQAIDIGADTSAFIKLTANQPSRAQTFAEAKADATAELSAELHRAALYVKAKTEAAKLKDSSLKTVAAIFKKQPETIKGIKHNGKGAPEWLTDLDLNAIFEKTIGTGLAYPLANNDDLVLVGLTAKHQAKLDDKSLKLASLTLSQEINNDLKQQMLEAIIANTSVEYNMPLLAQIFEGAFDNSQLPVPEQNNGLLSKLGF